MNILARQRNVLFRWTGNASLDACRTTKKRSFATGMHLERYIGLYSRLCQCGGCGMAKTNKQNNAR